MQKITPFLWFDSQAEEAVKFYTSIFKDSKVISTSYYGEGGPMPKDTVLVIAFQLNGQEYMALNGGAYVKFNEAISLAVNCETQQEIDYYWDKLSAGGSLQQCGWLKDKYGLSWQVMPSKTGEWLSNKDRKKADRVMAAVMKMVKLDMKAMQDAFDGK
ncbi:MAG TPA: VOC family protein [Ohtaekwangia sp.]|uniref:VOC family protein n=1 Tax=Ohtaekwangia sp. TaxID=2066019 RepID=UPI002F93D969